MAPRLAGKVAIVTGRNLNSSHPIPSQTSTKIYHPGAASGFGASIATTLSTHGARVLVADINFTSAQAVASTTTTTTSATTNPDSDSEPGKGKGEMLAVRMDVTSREDWERVVQLAVSTWGAVDVLVNCAGGTYVNKVLLPSSSSAFYSLSGESTSTLH